jgi:hypothetical protein
MWQSFLSILPHLSGGTMVTSQTCCHLPGELLNSAAECADRARMGMLCLCNMTYKLHWNWFWLKRITANKATSAVKSVHGLSVRTCPVYGPQISSVIKHPRGPKEQRLQKQSSLIGSDQG